MSPAVQLLLARLLGAVVAIGAFTLAATVLHNTGADLPVASIGGLIGGWLGLPTPEAKARPSVAPKER
jgi:hypothetical protein